MSEEFFERLEKFFERLENQVYEKIDLVFDIPTELPDTLVKVSIRATIEALREMMVGEPRRAIIQHHPWYVNTGPSTDILFDKTIGSPLVPWHIKKHGTDGEEVIVLVVCLS